MTLWLSLVACAPELVAEPVPLGAPCAQLPCVSELSGARLEAGLESGWTGYRVAVQDDVLVVGAPDAEGRSEMPQAVALSLPDLVPLGAWRGRTDDLTGLALAATDLGGGGVIDVAIGAPAGTRGAVHLVHGLPDGGVAVTDVARATFLPDPGMATAGLHFGDVFGDAETELLVATNDLLTGEGAVYVVDPGDAGTFSTERTVRTLEVPDGVWSSVHAWDGAGFGLDGLVIADSDGVHWFQPPWHVSTRMIDAHASWTSQQALDHGLGLEIATGGDLDGDGLDDLVFSAATHDEPAYRAGRAYVALSGQPRSADADELPVQIRGVAEGEALGFSLAAGDIDGDAWDDLVVGAPVVFGEPRPGAVHVFLGPLEGVQTSADADATLYGERDEDFLGRELAVVPGTDSRSRIVATATAWPAGQGRGAVYLLEGWKLF